MNHFKRQAYTAVNFL